MDIGDFIKLCFVLFVISLAMMLMAWSAPILIFAMKAGWLRTLDERLWRFSDIPIVSWIVGLLSHITMWFSMGGISAYIFLLIFVAIASFGWPYFVLQSNVPALVAYCSAFCGPSRDPFFASWFSMLGREFWPFAIAVAVTMTTQAWLSVFRGRGTLLIARCCFLVFAALLFTVILYQEQFFAAGTTPVSFAQKLAHRFVEEIKSSFALIWTVLLGSHGSLSEWLTNEMVKMHGSLFRISSLYPKIFWVLILSSITISLFRSGSTSEGDTITN